MIRKRGPWQGLEDVVLATLEWVWCFNHHLSGTPPSFRSGDIQSYAPDQPFVINRPAKAGALIS